MEDYFHVYADSWNVPVETSWLVCQEPLGCQCGRVLYPRKLHPLIRDPEAFGSVSTTAGRPPKKIGGKILLLREDIVNAIGKSLIERVFHCGTADVMDRSDFTYSCLIEKEPCNSIFERAKVCLFYSRCSECSKPLYGYSSDTCYIVGQRLEDAIYANETKNSLFVRGDVAGRIAALGIKEVVFSRVVFSCAAPDGLPLDLNEYAGEIGVVKKHYELKKPKRNR